MQLVEIKSEFHSLIDQIDDAEVLEQFFNALNSSVNKSSSIWQTLTPEQQQSVLDAYDESEKEENNFIPLSDVIKRMDKW